MSIAVSAVVQPSRRLFLLVGGMLVILFFIAGLIASGRMETLPIAARIALTVMCIAVALHVFFHVMWRRKIYVIHISGTGQIRILQRQKNEPSGYDSVEGEVVHLLPVSTLWSGLLLLHFQNDQQQTVVVTILPDSVSPASFKAVLLACRWIVSRHADTEIQRQGGD